MKSILLHNFTKSNVHRLGAFLEKHRLFNIYAIIPGEDFTEVFSGLATRYGLNVIIPLSGLEGDHQSVAEIIKRNPKFEDLVSDYPRNKIEILRRAKQELDPANLIGLGLNWPRIKVRALRSNEQYDSFHEEMGIVYGFIENDPQGSELNIAWASELEKDFELFNYGLVESMDLIGDNVCLATQK